MLELLTKGSNSSPPVPTVPIIGYNFDRGVSTSVPSGTSYSGGTIQTIDSGSPLAGYTNTVRTLNTQIALTNTAINTELRTYDFTAEGWFWFSVIPATYQTIFLLRWSNADIYFGFGDSGFGYRLHSGMRGAFSASELYSTTMTRTTAPNAWHHYAMVRKNGRVSFFVDGIKQMLASGTSTTYNITDYNGVYDLNGTPSIRQLGGYSGSVVDMYCPEFVVSTGAKYTANFTPPTGPIVPITT